MASWLAALRLMHDHDESAQSWPNGAADTDATNLHNPRPGDTLRVLEQEPVVTERANHASQHRVAGGLAHNSHLLSTHRCQLTTAKLVACLRPKI
jgi:hypothetical protein